MKKPPDWPIFNASLLNPYRRSLGLASLRLWGGAALRDFAMAEFKNLLLLTGDAVVYFAVLAALFRARSRLGIGAFFCALGVMHFLETYLASTFLCGAAAGRRHLAGLDGAVHRQADAAAAGLHPGRCGGGSPADLRAADRQSAAVSAGVHAAQPFVSRPRPRRRPRIPRRDRRADGLGHGDPVLRLHLHHPDLRTLAGLVWQPDIGARWRLPAPRC